MSQTVITLAFEHWKAQQGATGEPVLLDEFVFANVPGLNPDIPVDRSEALPPVEQIVHRQPVTRTGVVNENGVVYSAVLGADVGDFSFNWIGLLNKASGTLAMIVHAPVQQKLKTAEGQQGNVLTRSFLMEYNGAQTETGITAPAETWQIDFTARMAGMDERQRLENADIYGAAAFFGDGWLVGKTGNQFFVTNGTGYVAGLRTSLAANQNITVTTKPVKVWLDVCWTGSLTSVWNAQSKITVAESLADYVQNGVQHYVFAVASIDVNGNITDLRPKGTLNEQQASDALKKHEQSRNHPDATISEKGFTRLSSATDSDSEELAATSKAVKIAMDNANARLAKERNGADIPNVPLFLQNLGLGDVLHRGDFGVGRSVRDSAAQRIHVGSFFYEPGIAGLTLYPLSVAVMESGGPTQEEWGQLAITYGSAFKAWLGRQTYGGQIETSELYHDKRKPTNADVGSYPATGGILNGDMSATGHVTSGADKDISSSRDVWAGRDIFAQRNLSATAGAIIGTDLTVGRNISATGNIDAGGFIRSGANHDVVSSQDIWATRYIYENGVRLYGPGNPPPSRFTSALNTISWEKNLDTGVITQWGFISLGDNTYSTIYLPIAFPTAFTSLVITPAVPGAIYASDVTAAGGKIIDNGSFGAGLSSNYNTPWAGAYFEAKGH